jgi:hypothetical protein
LGPVYKSFCWIFLHFMILVGINAEQPYSTWIITEFLSIIALIFEHNKPTVCKVAVRFNCLISFFLLFYFTTFFNKLYLWGINY